MKGIDNRYQNKVDWKRGIFKSGHQIATHGEYPSPGSDGEDYEITTNKYFYYQYKDIHIYNYHMRKNRANRSEVFKNAALDLVPLTVRTALWLLRPASFSAMQV